MAQLTPKQALDRATEWLRAEDGITVGDDGAVIVEGTPPLDLQLTADDDRIVITHVHQEAGAGASRADAVMASVPDRGTTLRAAAAVSKSGLTLTFTNPVYIDGLTRQALVTSVNDLVATVDRLGGTTTAETRVHKPVAAAAAKAETATDTAEVEMVTDGWKPSHRVPSGGMRAWDEPDPAAQPSSRLEARVELQIAEQRGDWARVVGSNGWTGWVDARKLEVIGGAAAARTGGGSTIDLAGFSLRPMPLVGAAALLLAAFLPWVSVPGGQSINSFDVALSFLWDITAAGSPYLGFALIAVAVLAVVVAASKPNPGLTRVLGIVAVAIAAAFVVSMYRGVSDGGGTFGDVFDLLGVAPWVTIGGGAVLFAASRS